MNVFQQTFIEWSNGNPGAALFLVGLFKEENIPYAILIMNKIEKCKTLRGTNLYVWFNDLCDRNYSYVAKLCKDCPDEILEDACSRHDYSGVKLIEQYLK